MSTLTICPKCDALNRVETTKALQKTATCGKCYAPLNLHALVSEVSAEGLKRILAKAQQPVIVDFWASWCGPCRTYTPIFEQASKANPQAIFLKINTETNPQLSSELGIRGIPTTIVFKKGLESRRESGVLPEQALAQILSN